MGCYDNEILEHIENVAVSETDNFDLCYDISICAFQTIEKALVGINNEMILGSLFGILYNSSFTDSEKVKSFDKVFKSFTDYGLDTPLIINSADIISSNMLRMLIMISPFDRQKICREAFALYTRKNGFYNDNWHKNGMYGVTWDIKRKITRLNAIMKHKENDSVIETTFDTIIDTFIYSIFLYVYFNTIYID